jgi:pimeloyl-ACP methyl ester carboxylesterase
VIGRRFQAPRTDWGPGHRGVDYLLPSAEGVAVRAAGSGRVTFAGQVGGFLAVTIQHSGAMATTYSQLAELLVDAGDYVHQGAWVGRASFAHALKDPITELPHSEDGSGLHFGVKVHGEYVDPEDHLGPLDVSNAIHLAPLIGDWAEEIPNYQAGSYLDEECRSPNLPSSREPPNENIVVLIPGISSTTVGRNRPEAFGLPAALGYAPERTYFFSFEGSDDSDLHETYRRTDTHESIRSSAGKLAAMLIRLARQHPGTDVDLIGHSQGGLIARAVLEHSVRAWQPGLPRIDHLITISTPHRGTTLAGLGQQLGEGTLTGELLARAARRWSERGGPIPDPYADALRDMSPGSTLLEGLAAADVVLGTKVLSLAPAGDLLVPANRARWEGESNRILTSGGLSAHTGILSASDAIGIAGAFLRDGPDSCVDAGDYLGSAAATGVDAVHRLIPELYSTAEEWLFRRLWRGKSGRSMPGPAMEPRHR